MMLAPRWVGSSGEVEVDEVESQKETAKSKIMIFAKSKKQAFGAAFLASKTKFQYYDTSSRRIVSVITVAQAIDPTILDTRPTLNGTPGQR